MKPVKDAYDSQERFIQDAAHELRNPLAAMTIALQNAGPAKQKDPLVKTFTRQTKRLITINEDLLFLERRNKQNPEKLELNGLLEEITEELQPLAVKRKVSVNLSTNGDIHKTIASGDYVRLVKNIIDNAIKYSNPGGKVKITQEKVKNDIKIIVADNGIGIPEKDSKSIGGRFFRASNTGNIDGTGLGLAIVQKILNVYGGKISINSKVSKGTTVVLTLPA
jgi:signal transduction histidine kinase